MKKYICKIILFFFAVAIIDVLFGIVCQYLNNNSKGGGVKSRYYVCKETNEDVLVFGSSRAKSHYVPDIIEDSLGMTCYNTGEDGNGIILSYGYLKMITERYSPQLIIYDVYRFDIDEDDNMKYLDLMKPYYYEKGIDSIFWSVNPKMRLMMFSNLYRYNTTCIRLVGDYVHPMSVYPKGYFGITKTMDFEPEIIEDPCGDVDSLKIYYFEKFIQLIRQKEISLVCCMSPLYKACIQKDCYTPIIQLCNKYDVPFIYLGDNPEISCNKNFFGDRIHLNENGAKLYTEKVIDTIKKID